MREVILSKRAANKLNKLLEYLEIKWSEKIKIEFISKLDYSLKQIKSFPEIGQKTFKVKGVHRFVITKQTTIYYKFNNKEIRVITIFDTRMDPKKLDDEI